MGDANDSKGQEGGNIACSETGSLEMGPSNGAAELSEVDKKELDELVKTIEEGRSKFHHYEDGKPWCDQCIFPVPRNLRAMEEKSKLSAYVPQLISIGPYHRGDPGFIEMEEHKRRCLHIFLNRTRGDPKFYLNSMWKLKDQCKQCYAGEITIKDRDFVEMMLLDSCFILELFRAFAADTNFTSLGYSDSDPIFAARGVLPCIQRDLLMLENQIPFFVLETLSEKEESVSQLALNFFDSAIGVSDEDDSSAEVNKRMKCADLLRPILRLLPYDRSDSSREVLIQKKGLHLLDVLRQSILPPASAAESSRRATASASSHHQPLLMEHSASTLRDAGVRFKARPKSKLTDIKFDGGILEIPPLVIHDSTKSIFLNLMAFEQCYPQCGDEITSYVNFMDGLINLPRDVDYLFQKGIITHRLGSEEAVAQLINRLCREIAFDSGSCYLSDISDKLNKYVARRWPGWRATLKHEYFQHPWASISVVVGILIIGLTVAQTIFSILSYQIHHS